MTGTNWNPDAPSTAGLQWLPTRTLPKPLTQGSGVGVQLASTAAESIVSLNAFLRAAAATSFVVDIYDAANLVSANPARALAVPSINFDTSGGWQQRDPAVSGGAWLAYTSGAFAFVNEAIPDTGASLIGDGKAIRYQPTSSTDVGASTWQNAGTYVDGVTGSGSISVTGLRVGKIQVRVVAKNSGTQGGGLNGKLQLGDGLFHGADGGAVSIPAGSGLAVYTFEFAWNPLTGLPWLTGDIAQFTSGGPWSFGVKVGGSVGTDIEVWSVNIIFTVTTERRVATGQGSASAIGGKWSQVPMLNPVDNSVASWSKLSGHTYELVFSLPAGGGFVSLVGVDDSGIGGSGLTGWRGAAQPTSFDAIPTAAPTLSLWVPGIYMLLAASLGVDAQPYVNSETATVSTGVGATKQGLAGHGTASYGGVKFILVDNGLTPTAPLICRIRRTSDDVQMGGDVTIAPGSVVFNSAGFALVTSRLASSGSLASGTAYYLQWTSATDDAHPWVVVTCASDVATTAAGTAAAAGGIGGSATINGTADAQTDIISNVQTVPTAPASLTAVVGTLTANSPPGGPTKIHYAATDWGSTSLGGSFGYYELQRNDDGTWRSIAFITDESNSFFNDFESLRGVVAQYRVRVVRADGALSDWTT